MRTIVCKEFGPPEKLVLEEVAERTPGPGELIIEVRAATVTFPDSLMIEDKYQFKAAVPFVPGGARYLRTCSGDPNGGFA